MFEPRFARFTVPFGHRSLSEALASLTPRFRSPRLSARRVDLPAGSTALALLEPCDPGKGRLPHDCLPRATDGSERADDRPVGEGGVLLVQVLPRDAALCDEVTSAVDRRAKAGSYDFQKAGVSNTSTGIISMRPIHIMMIMTARVVVGKPA